MADISKITTLDGTEYNIKDATARSLISNLPANNLQNLVDGSIPGSVRGTYTTPESENYTIGYYAFAEGMATKASGIAAHAEGRNNAATGDYSHVEGRVSTASGDYSHAEGQATTASGEASHAEGHSTIANHQSQHVFGEYNIADDSTSAATSKGTYVEIVGNGISVNNRSNARTLDWNGNELLAGTLTTGIAAEGDGDETHQVGVIVKTDIDPSSSPTDSSMWYRAFSVKDSSDTVRAYVSAIDTTNLGQGVQIETKRLVNGSAVYNGVQLRIKDDGSRNVALSDAAAWRAGLGLGTDGALPLTIDQGGTGATTRLNAFKNLTAQDVGDDAQYFVTLTQNWAKAGYSNRLNAFKAMNNSSVGADVTNLVTFKSDWTKCGYSTLRQVRNAMGLGDTTGVLPVANGGTALTSAPTLLVNLESASVANIFQAEPRPGITGTLGANHGGTGLTSAPSMLTDLGSTTAASIFVAKPRPGITGTLAIAHGGTGATSKPSCITNLGGKPWISVGSVTSTASKTITFSGNARAVLIADGTAAARQGMWIIYGLVGTPVVTTIKAASHLTVTAGTNKVTITSSSTSNASSYLLVLDGYASITVS